jgi:hypothetical protein
MNAAEFKALALDRLDKLDDAELHASMPGDREADMFGEIVAKFRHACAAFPGLTWEEFTEISRCRNSVPRRGRPKTDPITKAKDRMGRAARDVQRIRDLWREMGGTSRNIPANPIEIAADLHDVNEHDLGERVRRPLSRR